MDFSKLSYGQVQAMADQLHNASSEMDSTLTEIKALFERIGNDDVWSGTAASTTKEEFDHLALINYEQLSFVSLLHYSLLYHINSKIEKTD